VFQGTPGTIQPIHLIQNSDFQFYTPYKLPVSFVNTNLGLPPFFLFFWRQICLVILGQSVGQMKKKHCLQEVWEEEELELWDKNCRRKCVVKFSQLLKLKVVVSDT